MFPDVRSANDPDARPWPPELIDAAAIAQATLGPAAFEAPELVWLTGTAFIDRLRAGAPVTAQLDPQSAEGVRRFDDVHRALGIATLEFDVLDVNRETIGVVPGVYETSSHTVLVRGAPSDDSILRQAALVHEVGHAWQGPDRIRGLFSLGEDPIVSGALIEGEAELVTSAWVDQLSDEARAAYDAAVGERNAIVSGQPASLIAEARARYLLGRRLLERAADTGGLDATRLVTTAALLDPTAHVEQTLEPPIRLPAPELDGASVRNVANEVTPLLLFEAFAATIPVGEALDAARAVQSSSQPAIAVDETGRTCVAIAIQAHADRSGLVDAALTAWAAALPDHRVVTPLAPDAPEEPPGEAAESSDAPQAADVPLDLQRWRVDACDPGPGAVPITALAADDAVIAAAALLDGEAWASSNQVPAERGRCRALAALADGALGPESSIGTVTAALDAIDPTRCP